MGTHSMAMLGYGVVLNGDLPKDFDNLSFTKDNKIKVCSFGDHENNYYAVVMEGTLFSADERNSTFINPVNFQISQEDLDKFKEKCKFFKTKNSPQWILMSRYD